MQEKNSFTSSPPLAASSTPLMQQYFAIKEQHKEGLILFQVGDFYELFFEDAQQAAATLAITLTSRGKNKGEPIPLCGVPVQARDYYVARLVRAGFRVVICDQLEVAVPGKVVARGVTQVLTPGTLTDTQLLDEKSASYAVALMPLEHRWGLVFAELLTGSLSVTSCPADSLKDLEHELVRFLPDEVILPAVVPPGLMSWLKKSGYAVSIWPEKEQEEDNNVRNWLIERSRSIPTDHHMLIARTLSFFFSYLEHNRHRGCEQFTNINWYDSSEFLLLDTATQRNLEIVKNNQDGTRKNSLFELLDYASTAMGSRMIKRWLLRPLVNQSAIEQRHEVIDYFMVDLAVPQQIESIMNSVGDIERMLGRISLSRASVADYVHLVTFLKLLPDLKNIFVRSTPPCLLRTLLEQIGDFSELARLLEAAFDMERSGDALIKKGFNLALDELKELLARGMHHIFSLEIQERQATGIGSLKIQYNSIQGYTIEVTKPNLALIPAHYIRVQTLVGKERFTTVELKQLEAKLNSARTDAVSLEQHIFNQIKEEIGTHLNALIKMSNALATIDALFGFWKAAYEYSYIRPQSNDQNCLSVKQGRHPVIEQKRAQKFIANDLLLDAHHSVLIITGPNMGGKSTYLRQAALMCIMNQAGSFVPAESASLAVRDRIFTRIGASDNVAEGKSTFLVEMEEAATICRYATPHSLVILDEVGRGTSTFDGLALAQAVLEYCRYQLKAPTLFATHYHELTALATVDAAIRCLYAESVQAEDKFLLTYRIKEGIAEGSFGIEVAKMAGLPTWVIQRAQELLKVY